MRRFRKGTGVRVDSFGLAGSPLLVAGYRAGGFHTLIFAHNGNAVPGFYHCGLLRAEA